MIEPQHAAIPFRPEARTDFVFPVILEWRSLLPFVAIAGCIWILMRCLIRERAR
jgi:hypothetical protein